MTNGVNGYHLGTTEEIINPADWASSLADIAPLLDDVADRAAFDKLKTIRESMVKSIEGVPDVITGLELADYVLTAGSDDERRHAMDRLLFWADENRPLDTHSDWGMFDPPSLEWIIEGWLPAGRIGMLSGQGGRGKSRLALQVAAAMAAGGSDFLGGPSTAHGSYRRAVQGALKLSCTRHGRTTVMKSDGDFGHSLLPMITVRRRITRANHSIWIQWTCMTG